jgi:hypothetical protein
MADWQSLRRYLEANYTVSGIDLESVHIDFSFTDGRSQLVTVFPAKLLDQEWGSVLTRVCTIADLEPVEAIERNAGLVGAALSLLGDDYVLTYSFPLEDLDPSEVDRALMLVATMGDTLEEEFAKADDR